MDSMAHFMDECRPFLEKEIQANIDDDIMAMILAEVIRYRARYEVSKSYAPAIIFPWF